MNYKKIVKLINRTLAASAMLLAVSALSACSDDDDTPAIPDTDVNKYGVFVVCEGNYGASNSSLTWANMEGNSFLNEIFYKANDVTLGSQAQSMTTHDDDGWVVVSDSHVIFKSTSTHIRKKVA